MKLEKNPMYMERIHLSVQSEIKYLMKHGISSKGLFKDYVKFIMDQPFKGPLAEAGVPAESTLKIAQEKDNFIAISMKIKKLEDKQEVVREVILNFMEPTDELKAEFGLRPETKIYFSHSGVVLPLTPNDKPSELPDNSPIWFLAAILLAAGNLPEGYEDLSLSILF